MLFRVVLRAGRDLEHGKPWRHQNAAAATSRRTLHNGLVDVARMLVEPPPRAQASVSWPSWALERREARPVV